MAARRGDAAVNNRVKTPVELTMVNEAELAWVAGLLEGEGTVGLYVRNRAWNDVYGQFTIYNTDLSLLSKALEILRTHGVENIRLSEAKRIKRQDGYKRKRAYRIVVSEKFSLAITLRLVVPYMYGAKRAIALGVLAFVARQASVRRYRMTVADRRLRGLVQAAQGDFGEALHALERHLTNEGVDLGARVIPTEAAQGLVRFTERARGRAEPLESRGPSPNGTGPHELPASRERDDDVLRSSAKAESADKEPRGDVALN